MDDLIPEKQDANIPFHVWLKGQFETWVAIQLGRGKGIQKQQDFAEYIGITENAISQYLLGKRAPAGEAVDKLAAKLGSEVYDRLGIPRRVPKDRVLYFVMDNLRELDEAEIKEIVERIKNRKASKLAKRSTKHAQEDGDRPLTA